MIIFAFLHIVKAAISHLLELFKYICLACIGLVDERDNKKTVVVSTENMSKSKSALTSSYVIPQLCRRSDAKPNISAKGKLERCSFNNLTFHMFTFH